MGKTPWGSACLPYFTEKMLAPVPDCPLSMIGSARLLYPLPTIPNYKTRRTDVKGDFYRSISSVRMGIFFVCSIASRLFGRMMVSTPFLNVARILSSSTSTGKGMER